MVNHVSATAAASNHKANSPAAWYEVFLQVESANFNQPYATLPFVPSQLVLFGQRVSFQSDTEHDNLVWAIFNGTFPNDVAMRTTTNLIQEGIENGLAILSSRAFIVRYHAHRVCRTFEYHSSEIRYGVAESLPRHDPLPASESEEEMARFVEAVASNPRLREAARQLKHGLSLLDSRETGQALKQIRRFFDLITGAIRSENASWQDRFETLCKKLSLSPEAARRVIKLFPGENSHAKRTLSPEEALLVKQVACKLMLQVGLKVAACAKNGKVRG